MVVVAKKGRKSPADEVPPHLPGRTPGVQPVAAHGFRPTARGDQLPPRDGSAVPLQSLMMLNDAFLNEQADFFGEADRTANDVVA